MILSKILILVNFSLISISVKNNCYKNGKIEINHILLFSLGFLYYFILPIIIGMYGLFPEKPAMELWYSIFETIEYDKLYTYLLIINSWYIAFVLGSKLSKNKFQCRKNKDTNFNEKHLEAFWYLFFSIFIYFIYNFRNEFFKGYTGSVGLDFTKKGPFVALSLMIFSLVIIYISKIHLDNRHENFIGLLKNKYFLLSLVSSTLVISLGGRLYFISTLISVIVYYTVYYNSIKISRFIGGGIIIGISMAVFGVLRTGNINNIIEKVFFNILQEPLYTSFSLISFIKSNSIELINFPIFLLSSIINFIPTFLFPGKMNYIINPKDLGYIIFNPLGATNSYVSFSINFGIIGTIFVFFLLGLIMQFIKDNESVLSKTIYVMLSGFLAFTFFRDGFETSIIKNMIQFSILIPFFIIIILEKVEHYSNKKL